MRTETQRIQCELVGEKQRYHALLDLTLRPIEVDALATPVKHILIAEQLAPGQEIPNGNYTRQPHSYDPKESRVHVESSRMYAGWHSVAAQ